MGRFYDASVVPEGLRRSYDVYDRLKECGIQLGTFEDNVHSAEGRNIVGVTFHESGLVYLSGYAMGSLPMNDDAERVDHGKKAAEGIADHHIRALHWAIVCGNEGGNLNDVLYTVKALGMVVSTDVGYKSAPSVVNGYSARWQSVFGGGAANQTGDGRDPGGFSGVHARSAIGGFTGAFSLEIENIVAMPPELTRAIIGNRGWLFPLIPAMYDKTRAANRS